MSSRFHDIGNFSCFYISCAIFNVVFKVGKKTFGQKVLGLGIFLQNYLKVPKVSRKREAAS